MAEPDYEQLYKENLAEKTRLTAEVQKLTHLLEELQKSLQSALEGNSGLSLQLKDLQEKLDMLLAKKKNRDRRDFDSKNEGRNPRPATIDKPPPRNRSHAESPPPDNFIDSPDIPEQTVPHYVDDSHRICPHCHIETEFVSNTVTYQLEKLVCSLKRLKHQQEVRSCPKCKAYITTANKPSPPIPGSYAGPGLLADVVVSKVEDGLPNNRQQKIYRRQNIAVPRSTQCDWFIAMSTTCRLLYDLLNAEILKSEIIQTDESGIKIQDRKLKKNIRKGKMVAYRGDAGRPFVSFRFSPDLSFDDNKAFLKDFKGIVQADAARGFDALFKDGSKIEAGCNAHLRRKIFDARELEPELCDKMLDLFTAVYKIEHESRNESQDVRLARRRRKSKHLMKKLRKMLVQAKDFFSPSHLLAEAATYGLNHWHALNRFLKNPRIDPDNNAIEREIKSLVLSRKNFLFSGSNAGAEALAIHLSLVASAKRNGLNPIEYLTDVFARINDLKTSEIRQLLPDQWMPLRKQNTAHAADPP